MTRGHIFLAALVLFAGAGCAGKSDIRLVDPGQGMELTATPFFAQKKYQCGPAALAMVLGASGIDVQPDDLVPGTYLPGRRGSLQVEMAAATRQWGRIPYPVPPDLAGLTGQIQSGRPALVLQNLGLARWPVYHYAVVIGVHPPDRLILRSGTRNRLEMTAVRFNTTWRRAGSWGLIVLSPGEIPENADPVTFVSAVADFESAGNTAHAAAAYRAALDAWPDDLNVQFALANNYLQQEKHAAAALLYRRVLAADPDHVAAANNLAEALARQGYPEQALAVIQAAVITAERIRSPLLKVILETRQEIKQALQEINAAPAF
ncbi:MAG: PA2778 family cysteine peptidase [Desulfotignum sp.]